MIKVVMDVSSREDAHANQLIVGYELNGHADSDEYGKDIVCASATTLALAAINTITDVCGIKDLDSCEAKSGHIQLRVNYERLTEREKHDSQVVLRGFEINIESLVRQYPENISLSYRR